MHPFARLVSSTARRLPAVLVNPGSRPFCASPKSDSIVQYWHDALTQKSSGVSVGTPLQRVHTEQLRDLLHEALRVYTSGASTVMPEQVTSVFMRVYDELLTPAARTDFCTLLAREFGIQANQVSQAIASWQKLQDQQPGPPPEAFARVADRMRSAAEPLYMSLFPPISHTRHGIQFLVRMRADLLTCLQQQPAEGVALRALAQDLRRILSGWFSLGLLQLRRVTWSNSSAELLDRVRAGEAVHAMSSLEQLKQRLHSPDRRCFCFFHPSLPEVPLVILHTALLPEVPSNMSQILDLGDHGGAPSTTSSSSSRHLPLQQDKAKQQQGGPSQPNQSPEGKRELLLKGPVEAATAPSDMTALGVAGCSQSFSEWGKAAAGELVSDTQVACFYSISSTQPGLAGVDLGNFLIKRVALEMRRELPHLRHLVTLSPVPGFRAWLQLRLRQQLEGRQEQGQAPESSSKSSSSGEHEGGEEVGPARAEAGSRVAAEPALLLSEERAPLLACWQLVYGGIPGISGSGSDSSRAGPAGSSSGVCSTHVGGAPAAPATSQLLAELLEGDAWLGLPEEVQQEKLAPVLLRLCAQYLVRERRRNLALDSVANFHLRNGAELWRLNFRADLTHDGLQRSHGLMVNYMYQDDKVADRNRAYLVDHIIATSPQVQRLLSDQT